MQQRQLYNGLDAGKFLCALLILFYHYFSEHGPLLGILNEALSLYAVAVALFMVISGFLLFDKLESVNTTNDRWIIVRRQVIRIYKIYLLWSIPYLIFSVSQWKLASISIEFVFWTVQRWIFQSTFYTIWFMPILAIGLVIAFWTTEKLPPVITNILAVSCYIIGSLTLTYKFVGLQIPGFDKFIRFCELWLGGSRGWLFFAFPLLLVGRRMVFYKSKMKPIPTALLSCISILGILAEALIIRRISGMHTGIDLTVMMIPSTFCILGFLISIKLPDGKYAKWMRNMSTLIFMSQRLFLTVFPKLLPVLYSTHIATNQLTLFVFTCGGTVILSIIILHISKIKNCIRLLY